MKFTNCLLIIISILSLHSVTWACQDSHGDALAADALILQVSSRSGGRTRDLVRTEVPEQLPTEGFSTVVAAVTHAVDSYNPKSVKSNREHVGGILACSGGRYVYTHGRGRRNQAPVQFSIPQTTDCKLAALWHTHGKKGPHKSMFSPSDTASANLIGRPIYMADHTGTIRVYEPGAPVIVSSRTRAGSTEGVLKGSAIGTVVMPQMLATRK